jgi:hypothetical protein
MEAPSAAPKEAVLPVPDEVRALDREILSGSGAVEVVASLTTAVGPRLAGSAGDKLAVAWALGAMKSRGLANVHAEPVKVPVWQRGVESAVLTAPALRPLAITALGWSGATPPGGVEADLVRFDTLEALRAADPAKIAHKIVFLDVKMRSTPDGSGYGDAVPARGRGPGEAAKKGAAAIVIRSIGTDASRFPHTGAMHREKSLAQALPAAALSNADADLLERILGTNGGAKMRLTLSPRWLPDADSANVVGEVKGRERPNEVVVVGAHLDSWDLGEGALDDGAGCAIVLEAGRAIAAMGHGPRRTIRFVLFAAEENSLSGGKTYASSHAAEASSHVAAMEADLGSARVVSAGFLGGSEARDRFARVLGALAPLGVRATDRPVHGGADISPLRPLGVPLVELEQDAASYFDVHHTANDTLARLDPAGIAQAAAAFATAAWMIADMEGDLGRIGEADRREPSW